MGFTTKDGKSFDLVEVEFCGVKYTVPLGNHGDRLGAAIHDMRVAFGFIFVAEEGDAPAHYMMVLAMPQASFFPDRFGHLDGDTPQAAASNFEAHALKQYQRMGLFLNRFVSGAD